MPSRCGFGYRLCGRQFPWRRSIISNCIGREEIGRRFLGRNTSHSIIMPTSTLDGNQESEKERSGLSIAIAAFFSNPARCATTLVGRATLQNGSGAG
jgi:hypothetical protein